MDWSSLPTDWHWIGGGLTLIGTVFTMDWFYNWVRIAIGSAMDWEKWNELANLSRIGGLVTNRHWKVRLVYWLDLCRIGGGLTGIGSKLTLDWQQCGFVLTWIDNGFDLHWDSIGNELAMD